MGENIELIATKNAIIETPVTKEKLAILNGMKKKIGIIKLWPWQAAAEHESIERYRFACSLIGVEIIELDRLGFLLNGPRRKVTKDDVDFVISLHFETPKAYDCFSFGALWNPIDFYVDWGLETFMAHQFTHDGYFTCNSNTIERLARFELGDNISQYPMPQVNHTLSGPVYEASINANRRLVYCGINWEKLSKKSGRFDDVLRPLDNADVLDIFGPELVQNVKVWDDFKGYKYEVPFDGKSLIKEISNSGAVLALSSNAHLRSGIMSSRLFEGAAAGALVFADENPFTRKYFADETVPIEITGNPTKDANNIKEKLRYYNENPEEGFAIAKALQDKYINGYMLHNQLLGVYSEFKEWQEKQKVAVAKTKDKIAFLIFNLDPNSSFPSELLNDISNQSISSALAYLIVPKHANYKDKNFEIDLPKGFLNIIEVDDKYGDGANPIGKIMADVVDSLDDDIKYFTFMFGQERVYEDYSLNMLNAAKDSEFGAVCNAQLVHYDPAVHAITGEEFVDLWDVNKIGERNAPTFGNIVWKREYFNKISGALQFLNYHGIISFLLVELRKFKTTKRPMISFDLKKFEKLTRIYEQPYKPEKIGEILSHCAGADKKGNTISTNITINGAPFAPAMITALPKNDKANLLYDLFKSLPISPKMTKLVGFGTRFLIGQKK